MLSSEALVIWMFRIAMKEPIMAASTAIHTVALARLGSTASDLAKEAGSAAIEADGVRLDMARSIERGVGGNRVRNSRCAGGFGYARCLAARRRRARFDGRDHRHARPQCNQGIVAAVEYDPD